MGANRRDRALIIIGGREDKEGDKLILRSVAERVGGDKLVIATVATEHQEEVGDEYERIFRGLGVRHVYRLKIEERDDAISDKSLKILSDTSVVFFTGGDQTKITSLLGLTPVCQKIQDIYERGGTIAGTSAGASVMSETMMVGGNGEQTPRLGSDIQLAPGLGLIQGVIVDQHFAERGRIGRLIGAVARNPRMLGIGVDENTAAIFEGGVSFEIIGAGGACFIDAGDMTYSNLTDEETDRALSAFDLRVHILSQGDIFDCRTRRPKNRPAREIEEELLGASA